VSRRMSTTVRSRAPEGRCRKSCCGYLTIGTGAGPCRPHSVVAMSTPDTSPPAVVAMSTPDTSPPAVVATRLRKRYGSTTAVDDVSLRIEQGEVVGVLGVNGAGKTTTVELVAGLRRPDGGSVRVLGLDPHRERSRVRQVLGVQLQHASLHAALTVAELVGLYRTFYPRPRPAEELLELVGLTEQRTVRFEKLSGGQQQRLSIALALAGRPRVVVLDELTTGLDPRA